MKFRVEYLRQVMNSRQEQAKHIKQKIAKIKQEQDEIAKRNAATPQNLQLGDLGNGTEGK